MQTSASELRQFGLTVGGVGAVLFGLLFPWLFDTPSWPLWPWILFGTLAGLGLLLPMSLGRVYRAWLRFGRVVGGINLQIILTLVFYLVVLPTGLLMRLFGKDPMRRGFDANAETYRVESQAQERDHMERPF